LKKISLILISILCNLNLAFSQAGEWTWINGDTLPNQFPNFGTIGVPSPSNHPPSLYEPCEFSDSLGNLWLHGGYNNLGNWDALWKYDIATDLWTWVSGRNYTGASGIYGTKGVPAATNRPPHRSHGAASWVGLDGTFWVFGGISNFESRNDLWKYDPSTNMWTWMSGMAFGNDAGAYGTKGVPATYTLPPARHECVASWVDSVGNLWFYGGVNYNFTAYNDLWRYDIVTNQWTWMSGCNCMGAGQPDVYGIIGVPDPANVPGARQAYAHWTDNDGSFWMFGGSNFVSAIYYNDMWKYDLSANEWTWMNGPQAGAYYHYGTKCISDTADYPSPVSETRSCWQDSNEHFFILGGTEDDHSQSLRNDLWMYSKECNVWTWLNGDNTINDSGSFGVKGISSPSNQPHTRLGALGWSSTNGNFYLFGGGGGTSLAETYNDLWRYVPDPNCPQFTCTPPIADFTAASPAICPGTCTSFLNSSSNASSYQWYFPGGSPDTSTAANPTNICYYAAGSFDVQLIAINYNGSDTITLQNYITVFAYPPPQSIMQNGDTLFSIAGASSYQWYFNSNIINGATDYFYVATQSGNYNVVATDINGCEVEAVINNVIAANSQLAMGSWQLAIFPNPVSETIDIRGLELNSSYEISIFNVVGEKVFSAVDCKLPIANWKLSPGMYYLEISSDEKIYRTKFLKQ